MEDEKNGKTKLFTLSFLVILILGLIIGYTYTPLIENKTFTPDGFYSVTTTDRRQSPKVHWRELNPGADIGKNKCATSMKIASSAVVTPSGYTWIAPIPGGSITEDYIKTCYDEAGGYLRPFKDNSAEIIAPANCSFINTNKKGTTDTSVTIIIQVGNDYKMSINNAVAWWCNADNPECRTHSAVYGYGADFSECSAGYVIGIANENTTVTCYKRSGTTNTWEQINASEFYIR